MKLKFYPSDKLTTSKADVLLVGCLKGSLDSKESLRTSACIDLHVLAIKNDYAFLRQAKTENFAGKVGDTLVYYSDKSLAAQRVLVFGLGEAKEFTEATLRKALTAAFKRAKALKCADLAISLPTYAAGCTPHGLAKTAALYAGMVDYVINHQKTEKGGHKAPVRFKKLTAFADGKTAQEVTAGLNAGADIADAVNLARDLSNEPAGTLTPAKLVKIAEKIAEDSDGTITLTVHGPKALKKMGAKALLAVAQGSDEPPYLIDLLYTPKGKKHDDSELPELTIVGKSVTFDSGGLDIKPADGMRYMKRDMSGGAVTLSTMKAISALGLPVKVRCVMAATENMINGKAYKPGDVLHTMAGLTVEVGNTDAEGRLTLADAIEYAKRQGTKRIVDLATLTGAVRMMVGDVGCCLFSNNDALSAALVASGTAQSERILAVPMWEEYRDSNRSDMADLTNSGGAPGSTTAAFFLRAFAGEEMPWAHLDIASVAFRDREFGADPKGSTGFGVRTLVDFITSLAEPA